MLRNLAIASIWVACLSLPDAVSLFTTSELMIQTAQTIPGPPRTSGGEKAGDPAPVAAFRSRLDAYLALRRDATRGVPKVDETSDPARISAREKALGEAIANARPGAKAGELFGDAAPHVTHLVREDWQARSPADRQALFDELPTKFTLMVNQVYPTSLPLVSVPPALLAKLPALPEEVEYRFIGRHFALRDRDANVVIDVLFDVLPR
jgi:hypothetical protein